MVESDQSSDRRARLSFAEDAFIPRFARPAASDGLCMYGISTIDHIHKIRDGVDALELALSELSNHPSRQSCVEAELLSLSLHDQLRDIALWIHGATKGVPEP